MPEVDNLSSTALHPGEANGEFLPPKKMGTWQVRSVDSWKSEISGHFILEWEKNGTRGVDRWKSVFL